MTCAIAAASGPAAKDHASRNAPLAGFDRRLRLVLATYRRAEALHCQSPLGYEPYDERLRRLGQSPVIALASANPQREVVSDLLRLPHLSLSRRVRFYRSVYTTGP
jgi:hypothetical protein